MILPKRRQTADDLVVGLRVVPPPLLQSVLGHARKLFFRPRHPRSGRGDQGTFQDRVAQHAGTKIELNVLSTRNRGSARCTLPSSRIVRRTEGTRHGREREAREREKEAREGGKEGKEGREGKERDRGWLREESIVTPAGTRSNTYTPPHHQPKFS